MDKMYGGVNYIGLSTEEKPDSAKDGECLYEVDTKKVYICYNNEWWEM